MYLNSLLFFESKLIHGISKLLCYSVIFTFFLYFLNYLLLSKKIKNMNCVSSSVPILNNLVLIMLKIKSFNDSPCLQLYKLSKISDKFWF